jgi:CubicO group peptidase (beta-lactamase class C family)
MTGPGGDPSSELDAALAWFVKDNRLPGAAAGVIFEDKVAWSGGAGYADTASGMTADSATMFCVASITKTFTGTAIMQLRDDSRLQLDEPIATFIPELRKIALPTSEIDAVTVRRMLAHESGLASEPPGTDWTIPSYEGMAARTLERVADIATRIPPDQHPKYSNLAYQFLGEVVARVTGYPYVKYIENEILTPLGMTATSFDPATGSLGGRRATGYAQRAFSDELDVIPAVPQMWAEGGLWSCVDDLAIWISFQMKAYREADAQPAVLSGASLREMHTPRYLDGSDWSQAWGLSWFSVRRDDVVWIQHSGALPGFTSNICFDPDGQVGAIALINGSGDASALAMDLAAIARRAVRAKPPRIQAPVPTPDEYRPLLGLYSKPAHSQVVRLEWRDGKLTFIDLQAPSWHLTLAPTEDPRLFIVEPGYRQSGEPVKFHQLPDGRIDSVFLADGTLQRLEHLTSLDQPA